MPIITAPTSAGRHCLYSSSVSPSKSLLATSRKLMKALMMEAVTAWRAAGSVSIAGILSTSTMRRTSSHIPTVRSCSSAT